MTTFTNTATDGRFNWARGAGIAYLGVAVLAGFAEFSVRQTMVVDGNATATLANIAANSGVYSLAGVADLFVLLLDVFLAIAFWVLLKPINRHMALAALILNLLRLPWLGANVVFHFGALLVADRAARLVQPRTDKQGWPAVPGPSPHRLHSQRHSLRGMVLRDRLAVRSLGLHAEVSGLRHDGGVRGLLERLPCRVPRTRTCRRRVADRCHARGFRRDRGGFVADNDGRSRFSWFPKPNAAGSGLDRPYTECLGGYVDGHCERMSGKSVRSPSLA